MVESSATALVSQVWVLGSIPGRRPKMHWEHDIVRIVGRRWIMVPMYKIEKYARKIN